MFLITSLHDLAESCHEQDSGGWLFPRVGRLAGEQRIFRVAGGEPLPASYCPGHRGQVPGGIDETMTEGDRGGRRGSRRDSAGIAEQIRDGSRVGPDPAGPDAVPLEY